MCTTYSNSVIIFETIKTFGNTQVIKELGLESFFFFFCLIVENFPGINLNRLASGMSTPYTRKASEKSKTSFPFHRLSVSPVNNLIALPHDNRHIRLFDISGVRLTRLPRRNGQVCLVLWSVSICTNFCS